MNLEPMIQTGDVIFLRKNNFIANRIIIEEEKIIPKSFWWMNNQIPNMETERYSHVAIAYCGALFMESVYTTGVILTPLDKLLDEDNGIEEWAVYRSSHNIDEGEFTNTIKTYIEKLYNLDFKLNTLDTFDKGSYYCSQLVSRILIEENLLSLPSTNLGPSTLFSFMRTCAKDKWFDVTDSYNTFLATDESKIKKIWKTTYLILAHRIQFELLKSMRSENNLKYLDSALGDGKEFEQELSPKIRIDKNKTYQGKKINLFINIKNIFHYRVKKVNKKERTTTVYQDHINDYINAFEIDNENLEQSRLLYKQLKKTEIIIESFINTRQMILESLNIAFELDDKINILELNKTSIILEWYLGLIKLIDQLIVFDYIIYYLTKESKNVLKKPDINYYIQKQKSLLSKVTDHSEFMTKKLLRQKIKTIKIIRSEVQENITQVKTTAVMDGDKGELIEYLEKSDAIYTELLKKLH